MSKIAQIVKVIINKPHLLCHITAIPDAAWEYYVVRKYGYKNGLPTIDLLDLFSEFEETVSPFSFLEGSSLITDIALLKKLAKRYSHCQYLEIGTWRGESVANLAPVVEQCVTIDLPENEIKQYGWGDNLRFFSKSYKNVTHIACDSRRLDFSTLGKFDLIFIDGTHTYEAVKKDTRNVFKVLRDSSSVIVWHDYGKTPERIRWEVLSGILDGTPEHMRHNLYHVSNTLCAIYIEGEFKTKYLTFPQVPDKSFSIKLSATSLK